MTKIMLISPPEKLVLTEAGDRPNLGILYIASSLNKAGHKVEISDLNHDSYNTLNNKLENLNPDFIGMTAVSAYSNWIKDYSSHLKQNFPNAQLVCGGPHATSLPKDISSYFDYVVRGEGEEVILDIVEGRSKKGIINAHFIRDLKNLPNPARNLLPLDDRYGIKRSFGKRGTLMDSSRGCNSSCFYCTKFLRGNSQRPYSIENILNQMDEIQDSGFDWVYFTDDCFSFDMERTSILMDKKNERGNNLKFEAMTRTDCVNISLLKKMKKNGLECLFYGIEHMDDNVLELSRKRCNTKTHRKGVEMAKSLGIKVMGSFILNLPGATEKTMYDCLDFAVKQDLEYARFFGLQAYPGTPLWNNPEKFGYKITSRDITGAAATNGTTNVESENMPKLKTEEIVKDIRQKWDQYKDAKNTWEN